MSRIKLHDLLVKQACAFLLVILPTFFINALSAAEPGDQPILKAAIFIENKAGNAFNDKVSVLEDLITSRVTEQGFSVLSREALINSLKDKVSVLEDLITSRVTKKTEQGASALSREVLINAINAFKSHSTAETKASGETKLDQNLSDNNVAQIMAQLMGTALDANTFESSQIEETKISDAKSSGTKADQRLSNDTSALRLAQMMGADYIIVTSITSFGTEKKAFEGYGVKTVNLIHNLRVSYKILEAVQGGSLVADTVKVSKTTRFTEGSHTEDSDMINELLDEASVKIAESLSKKRIIPPPTKLELVEITIACGMQDLAQLPLSIPDVRLTKDDTVVIIGENKLEVQLLDVTVELNGTVIGSAPGIFKAPPGLNKIRLSREGFMDWERTINVMEGQKLKVALQMSDAGYARWKDNTAFLQKLKNGEKLTDAGVKAIEGAAQMLRQSGYKVDVKEDVNLDVKGDVKVDAKGGLYSIFRLFH